MDSDDEVLDDLVRRAEEIHKAETTTNKRDREEQKKKEYEKLRELLALHFKDARRLDELPPEQRAVLVEGASENGIKISALSSFTNV